MVFPKRPLFYYGFTINNSRGLLFKGSLTYRVYHCYSTPGWNHVCFLPEIHNPFFPGIMMVHHWSLRFAGRSGWLRACAMIRFVFSLGGMAGKDIPAALFNERVGICWKFIWRFFFPPFEDMRLVEFHWISVSTRVRKRLGRQENYRRHGRLGCGCGSGWTSLFTHWSDDFLFPVDSFDHLMLWKIWWNFPTLFVFVFSPWIPLGYFFSANFLGKNFCVWHTLDAVTLQGSNISYLKKKDIHGIVGCTPTNVPVMGNPY